MQSCDVAAERIGAIEQVGIEQRSADDAECEPHHRLCDIDGLAVAPSGLSSGCVTVHYAGIFRYALMGKRGRNQLPTFAMLFPFTVQQTFAQQRAFIEDPAKLKWALCTRRAANSYRTAWRWRRPPPGEGRSPRPTS